MITFKNFRYSTLSFILGLGLAGCGAGEICDTPTEDLPIAFNDTATVSTNSAEVDIQTLANDAAPLVFDLSSINIITAPTNGTATPTISGEVRYRPTADYSGTDSLEYTIRDTMGNISNPATLDITVTQLPDTTAPVITIAGSNNISVEIPNAYNDEGATAVDDRDGVLTVNTASTVDVTTAGDYTVTYTATDSTGNTTEIVRNVTVTALPDTLLPDTAVPDTTAPVITITGEIAVSLVAPGPYVDAGATANDNIDGILTVSAVSNVDATTPGSYTVTYTATDSSGNSTDAIRTVIITTTNQTLTITTPHIDHPNCLGGVIESGEDLNGNGVLDVTEITNTEAIYDEGTPLTREELDDMILEEEDVTQVNTCEIENMSSLFSNDGNENTFNQDISQWNVGSVTDMSEMFNGARAFNQDISAWDVSSVTDMNSMFSIALTFNQDIGTWDVSNVTDMSNMFVATDFDQDIGTWDVSNITDMSNMFEVSVFDQDIGTWDVSNVIDMSNMFSGTSAFNQDIGTWNVGNVTNMRGMFSTFIDGEIGELGVEFNQDIGAWDVSNVTVMSEMFANADAFNQDIGAWDVGNVTDMRVMFASAEAFDQDIGAWDVGNVTNMFGMFSSAAAFDQDIGTWDISNVEDMTRMFANVTLTTQIYDNILTGWNNTYLQTIAVGTPWVAREFDGGLSVPTGASLTARASLITSGWTITDGL